MNCIINKITFSIRELSKNVPYSATLIINGNNNIQVVIPDGSITFSTLLIVNDIILNELDLITMQVIYDDGALQNGVCISLNGYIS